MKILLCVIVVILSLQNAEAQILQEGKAGLVITPTRLELEGKQRSSAITIANNGTAQGSYRIQAINKKMTLDGQLVEVTPQDDNGMFADKMLRISPRSITIPPGGSQNVRILVRKPKDMADGEYRTHIEVMILPDDAVAESNDVEGDKLTIAIKANYGVTIPLIIREGNVKAAGQMSPISYIPANAKEPATVKFSISRQGNASLYGDIKIVNINAKGKESVIKFMGGMAIYTPNEKREFSIPLDEDAKEGVIKVIYQEKEKSGGKVIAEGEVKPKYGD